MPNKEYTVFFEDLSKRNVKAENIIAALQNVTPIEKVIRVSLYEKEKVSISNQIVDDEFVMHDEFRPPANT